MTRENKLALIIGFSLLLVVAVLLADHLSPAQQERLATLDARFDAGPEMNLPAGSGDQAVRQFAGSGEARPREDVQRQVRLIDPPIPVAQIQHNRDQPERNIDEAIDDAAPSEGADDPRLTPFGPIQPHEPASDPLVMGHPVITGSEAEPAPPANHGNAESYTVKQRETLYGLCKRFYGNGGLYAKLARFNQGIVPDSGRIREGMTLWIPSRNVLDGSTTPTMPTGPIGPTGPVPERPTKATKAVKTVNYTIKEDDRLWDIARDHLGKGGRWQEIVDLNRDIIKNPDVLPIGRTIRLPAK